MTPKDRFLKYVTKTDGCWLWTGAALPRGYGRFHYLGKPRYAHRVALAIFGAAYPADDVVVRHSCDNPRCVNPDHLSVGSQTDNMRDASARGRIVRKQDWRGERNPKSKLTDAQVNELLTLSAGGWSNRDLAARYAVTITRVQQIVRAKKHGGGWKVEEF